MMLELGRAGDKAMGPEAHRAKGGIILRSHVDVGVVAQDVAGHNIARSRSDRRRSRKLEGIVYTFKDSRLTRSRWSGDSRSEEKGRRCADGAYKYVRRWWGSDVRDSADLWMQAREKGLTEEGFSWVEFLVKRSTGDHTQDNGRADRQGRACVWDERNERTDRMRDEGKGQRKRLNGRAG
jgi:hypothetical protein